MKPFVHVGYSKGVSLSLREPLETSLEFFIRVQKDFLGKRNISRSR